MPNLDGGHYFLTVLAPIRRGTMADPLVHQPRSHRHVLAQTLSLLPTGRQTAASRPDDPMPPFAANTLNHFARFVIIDAPAFNGRRSRDSLLALALRDPGPLVAQPVDRLSAPYLLFAADIDAPGGGEAALRAYTDALWRTMHHELTQIFIHCDGYDDIDSAEKFHGYIRACQIETTMPFNDYWANGLVAADWRLPARQLAAAAKVAAGIIAAWLVVLLAHWLLDLGGVYGSIPALLGRLAAWGALLVLLLLAAALAIAYRLYRRVLDRGASPFPTAPGSDLPSVLKALYVQRGFTRLAIDAQGLDDTALHARFGEFLHAAQPADLASPTQKPGEVGA